SRESFIAESVWQITRSQSATAHGRRLLVLTTDLIENTPGFSAYRGDTSFFDAEGTLRDERWHADLRGVGVTVIVVHRNRAFALRGPALLTAWERLFLYCGASSVRFQLEGGA